MIYLKQFYLPSEDKEIIYLSGIKRTCYTTFYPFGIFPGREFTEISFEPVTIFCGGNGCGKTTLLNVIAEKLGAQRNALYNRSSFFSDYVDLCSSSWESGWQDSAVITSDDVFEYIFDIRALNEGIDEKREELLDEYTDMKYSRFRLRSLEDYEHLKKVNIARRKSGSEYVRRNVMANVREASNGESAFLYFTHKIQSNQIYLLDEPENSLSAAYQIELRDFIRDSARFYCCQFIIATHSPFLLSMEQAKIYDLDDVPVRVKAWTQVSSVRQYFSFFMENRDKFGEDF